MERASCLPTLSQVKARIKQFKQAPRQAQQDAFEALTSHDRTLNLKLPTGYGKTYAALGCFSILSSIGKVNRLLMIVPTDAQLLQFENACREKCAVLAINKPWEVCDVRFFGAKAIQKHQRDEAAIFAITVQSLVQARGMDNVAALIGKGRWMVVVDEYHHYGIDKPFSKAVSALNHEFMLCMSATPTRPNDDGAFGVADVNVSYRVAVKERAVKPLIGHAYHYKIDAITEEQEIVSFSTAELAKESGRGDADSVEKLRIKRRMRWSPKYISPLVSIPLTRMLKERIRSGYKLQAIIGAMCVSHAKLVCEQVSAAFPELVIDWVGTGEFGRTVEENRRIIKQFSPADKERPTLDVLVHVGIAGEGLDTVNVSEIVHLNACGVNNGNNQENGRAARYLKDVVGNINFDACSGYSQGGYIGESIMDAMDDQEPQGDEEPKDPGEPDNEWLDLPEEPAIEIWNVELEKIDSGDDTVQMMARQLVPLCKMFGEEDLTNPESELWRHAIEGVKRMRAKEAEAFNEKSRLQQWHEHVNAAMSVLTGNVIKLLRRNGATIEKSLIGDIKKRVNGRKKSQIGSVDELDLDNLQRHYRWIKDLESTIKTAGELPSWLW